MNCKPGDLALVVRPHATKTPIVEVLSSYTAKEFDGRKTTAGEWTLPCWLVKSLGGPIRHTGKSGASVIFPCPDAWLRPIRPGDISDEEVRDLYAPSDPAERGAAQERRAVA